MKNAQITSGLALLTACLTLIPTVAFAAPSQDVHRAVVTDARTEQAQFAQNLAQARQAMQEGQYDLAMDKTDSAKSWFLALADSVALENPGVSWDSVRVLEQNLLVSYSELGRLYHLSAQYQQELQVIAHALSLNPYQPELLYQQHLANVALSDANDIEAGDFNHDGVKD
ncbi:MAG: hypothetical protein ACAI44_34610 [Candidatus Sericytochromatia bacterium]